MVSAMKVTQEFNSADAAMAEHSVHLSRQRTTSNGSEMAVQNALVARSSRSMMSVGENTNFSSVGQELDAVVSGKFLGDIAGLGAGTLASAGMAIGSAVGNAAVVVGNHVVKTAKTSLNSLPETIKSAANHIGEHAVGVAAGAVGAVPIAGEMVVDTTVDLAGTALAHAEDSLQGLGRLATRLAETAWNEIKKIVDCLKEMVSLCSILIGDQCDCNGGSHVTIATDHFSVRCVFQTTSEFSKGFGINAVRQNKMDGTTLEGSLTIL